MGSASSSINPDQFQPNYNDFRLSSPLSDIEPGYDVIIIGSGYGGSIAASRAARAGKRVCVLEKGREWRPGDFPETELSTTKEVQVTVHGDKTVGDPTNLFDVVISPDVAVLQGCGLGGTSLINANVAMDCEPRVFEDEVWPKAFREDLDTLNNVDKKRVLEMLQPAEYPKHFPELTKMTRMAEAAAHIADIESLDVTTILKRPPLLVNFNDTEANRVGIPQPACINCGNCCGGCNTGAKNTLNMNYLPDAKTYGAHIFTQVEVTGVVKDTTSDGWRVHFVRHLRKHKSFKMKEQIVRAKVVILGAGTLGTTDILLKSRGLGLELSPSIGKRFTTNGNAIGFSYNGESVVQNVGKPLEKIRKEPTKAPGPAVTSIIDMRNHRDQTLDKSFLLSDCTAPSSVEMPYNIVTKEVESGFSLKRSTSVEVQKSARRLTGKGGKGMKNTLAMLAVSHDDVSGEIQLDENNDRVWIDYPNAGQSANFEIVQQTMERATESLKGTFIPNPFWGGLVAKMRDTNGIVTVQPLGGCCMGETGADGVVNHAGQVFVGDSAEVYQGLYVLDGSVMPRSLGVDPCLTISMIAERSMRLMAEQLDWNIDHESSLVLDLESTRARPGIRFTERLEGQMTRGEDTGPCELIFTIESRDVEQMLKESDTHEAQIHGTATCKLLSPSALTVSHGRFTMFSESIEHVQTREMTYKLNLLSAEGDVFYLEGTKVIHKDSAFEIGKKDTTQLEFTVFMVENHDIRNEIGKAKVQMKGGDIIKKLSTIEVTNAAGTRERLKWKTSFCAFFMGQMWGVYGAFTSGSTPFNPTAPPREKRPLRLNGTKAKVYPIETDDGIELYLTRYEGGNKGPVMLVHGMGVSSTIFSLDTVETNLVEFLVAEKYDVWVLEWRASTLLPSSMEKMTIDECAEYDIPAAVNKILSITGHKDIQIVSHCAGAAVTCATILLGKLQGKVRSLTISQSGFCNVPTRLNWWKAHLKLPNILYGIGVEGLTAYTDSERNWMGKLLDQFVEGTADVTTPFAQHCDNHVCHRITFLYGLLYEHCNFNQLTHETLHEHFGYGDAKLLKHFALCFAKEHIVNHEGKDVYLPDFKKGLKSQEYTDRIAYMDIPIQFCSGEKNSAFDMDSTRRAYHRLVDAHPKQIYERFTVPNYGHIDCIMGKTASKDVFPYFLAFLEKYATGK